MAVSVQEVSWETPLCHLVSSDFLFSSWTSPFGSVITLNKPKLIHLLKVQVIQKIRLFVHMYRCECVFVCVRVCGCKDPAK